MAVQRLLRRWPGTILAVLAALAACDRTPRSDAAPASKALASDAGAASAAATAPMRSFRCTRYLDAGKAPQGPLTVRFRPRGPSDFTFEVEFHCKFNCRPDYGICDYAAVIRAENGVLTSGLPGAKIRCEQSTIDGFAFTCSYLLRSDVETLVTARTVTHTVRFRVSPVLEMGIPDQKAGDESVGCLPFSLHDKVGQRVVKSINDNYLQFPVDGCQFDP